jgi:hypothetical protein
MIYLNGEFVPIEQAANYGQGGAPLRISPVPDWLRDSEEAAR